MTLSYISNQIKVDIYNFIIHIHKLPDILEKKIEMKESRIYVDFNEMIENNLVLLSKSNSKKDSNGNEIELKEGMCVKIYMDDENEFNETDNLIASGTVELNKYGGWTAAAKWNCRIDDNGITHESQSKKVLDVE